jgi:hypothetical protein
MGMFLRRGYARRGTPISDLPVGNAIKLNVGGNPLEFLIVHQGLPGDSYDESCDGAWLLMKDIYENRAWNSAANNTYESSTINTYLNADFYNMFDAAIQDAAKRAKIPYRAGTGSGGTDKDGANGLPCKVFLLSAAELDIVGTSDPVNGSVLAYFAGAAAAKRIATLNGAVSLWWTRTSSSSTTSAVRVNVSGNRNTTRVTTESGIRPAIILSSDFRVTDDMLV